MKRTSVFPGSRNRRPLTLLLALKRRWEDRFYLAYISTPAAGVRRRRHDATVAAQATADAAIAEATATERERDREIERERDRVKERVDPITLSRSQVRSKYVLKLVN